MNMKSVFILSFLTAFLSACATWSPLSISESTLEGYLQEQVQRFDQEQLKSGSPLSVKLSDVDITLGPDGREVAVLSVQGEVAVNALVTKIPVDVFLKVEGAPVYKSDEKAIYIRRLNLLDSRVESTLFKGDFKPVTDNLMRALAQMLETMPVYRLDESNLTGQLLGMADLDIKVAPGKLVLVPAEASRK
ncbi:hypothetical protein BTA51_11530 [Hahella sp. CCB-MM4]|uniref:DUF1439 domain-containing protein n=1 Tax=Hahella sp. (strain CCB-MM4) TaxID=1926491 RepID=UPI000B9BC7D3|nr:DUF1439 domain-containing protein [Hahella sp. CCB-MM4]OZG73121.1 hypothetical protein BTA51_11530 [Hahella sp. CCB-MM4]